MDSFGEGVAMCLFIVFIFFIGIAVGLEHKYESDAVDCLQYSEDLSVCRDIVLEGIEDRK